MRKAICPGAFDPVTVGHLDIIRRAAAVFDTVIVAVLKNSAKQPLFTQTERANMIMDALSDIPNVKVELFNGLLADFAKLHSPVTLIKGLRTVVDFEYEMQLSIINKNLGSGLDTFFIPCNPDFLHVSSSVVRELSMHGGDVRPYVTENVYNELKKIYSSLS